MLSVTRGEGNIEPAEVRLSPLPGGEPCEYRKLNRLLLSDVCEMVSRAHIDKVRKFRTRKEVL